jgi:hypothetical protein
MIPEPIWLILVLLLIAAVIFLLIKIKKQARQIAVLQGHDSSKSSNAFHYLAIGNSITLHGKCNYWWNEIGMAASTPDKDYFHLVTTHLKHTHKKVKADAYNFFVWETTAHDRTQTIGNVRPLLSADLDLITVQLSENASDLTTFSEDLTELLTHLRQACPKAKIVLVDDFWNDEKSALKQAVAEQLAIPFASLSHIRGKAEFQCGLNTTVYGDDHTLHTVEHNGVAAHPGDTGMQAIAQSIIDLL